LLYVEDVDAVIARAVELGATLKRPPQDQFSGDRAVKYVLLFVDTEQFANDRVRRWHGGHDGIGCGDERGAKAQPDEEQGRPHQPVGSVWSHQRQGSEDHGNSA
jgi:hypothetical protein